MSYCRRCTNSNLGSCRLGYIKSDQQIRDELFGCFQENILKIYDVGETKPDLLVEKGPYGDSFTASDISKEVKRLNRLKDSMLVRVEV